MSSEQSPVGRLSSSPVIHRHPDNPILTMQEVPYPSALVFNAGVVKYRGRYVMVFRNDYGFPEEQRLTGTNLGLAFSEDGIHWEVQPQPCYELADEDIRWVNDPRLTVIEGRCYLTFAIIARHGIRGGIAVTEDFQRFEFVHTTLPENRNLVLFPEKINGKFFRLDRPFANYLRESRDRFDVWIGASPDLRYWGDFSVLLKAEDIPFCNNKIGPGPPPLRTPEGWLVIFHAVDVDPNRGKAGWEERWDKRYTAGVALLSLDDPRRIRGVAHVPLLVPEAPYEISGGFRNNVVFPCGAVLEDDGEVKIYYGAADTVVCLATAAVDDLIELCLGGGKN